MTGTTERESSRERVTRVRRDARELCDQRALDPDEAEKALDDMVRRSIDLHGA
jgi:hypothetical protein